MDDLTEAEGVPASPMASGGADGGALSALKALAYGAEPQPGAKMLEQDPIDPSTKWLAYAAGALEPGNFSQSMRGALGALAGQQSKEQELKAKYMPIVANALMQRQMMQFQVAQQQLKLTQGWNGVLSSSLTGLLSKPGPIDMNDVVGVVGSHVQRGQVPLPFAQQFMSSLPKDPNELRAYITRSSIGALKPDQAWSAVAPKVDMQNTGAATVPVQTNPNAGVPVGPLEGGQPLPQQLSPQDRMPKNIDTPTGNMTVAPATGKAGVTGSPEAQAITAEALGPQGGGAQPPAGGVQLPPGAAPEATGAAPPAPSVTLGKDPAQLKYNEVTASNAAEYEQGLNDKVDAMRDLNARMGEMRKALKEFRPGAAAETRLKLGSWGKDMLASLGASPEKADAFGKQLAGGNIASMQDFQKVAVTGAMEALKSALPTGSRSTQMEFATFQRNNPSITMDPDGLDKVMNFMAEQYQKASAEQKSLATFKKSGRPMAEFREYWNEESQKLGFPGGEKSTGTSQGSVQPKSTRKLGLSASKQPIEFNDETGLWEYK